MSEAARVRALWRNGVFFLILTLVLSLLWGEELSVSDSLSGLLLGPHPQDTRALIIWWVRLPQWITAMIAGATLAISGAAMQCLMRNELADPYLLGVAAGGGLGAAVTLSLGIVAAYGLWALPLSSFGGALLASLWVERRASAHSSRSLSTIDGEYLTHQLILSGVALNLFLSALLTLTLALSDEQLSGVWRWLIGHVQGLSWSEIGLMGGGSLIGVLLLLTQRDALAVLPAGEEVAWSLGVHVKRTRSITLIAIAISVGAVVAYCGVIGFIGLLVPHMIRQSLFDASRHLLGLCVLYGSGVLCFCDLISRVTPRAVPIGVVTGVLGGALFLYQQRARL